SRTPQAASDHNVPTNAGTNKASGKMQIGRFTSVGNSCGSIVGTTAMIQSTLRIPTSEVDHGSDSAISTAMISAALAQTSGLRQAGCRDCTCEVVAATFTTGPPAPD